MLFDSQRKIYDCMGKLSSLLDEKATLIQGPVVLLDYPAHINVGDMLIWQGEQVFLGRNGIRIMGQYSFHNIGRRARSQLEKCGTICLQGGGNFGDLWGWHHELREEIIAAYPHKRIVIFPQSIHFEDEAALSRSCEILKQHKDLHIMVRDKKSLGLLQERGVANLILTPDMAHALWGQLSAPPPTHSEPRYLLRDDYEKGALPASLNETKAKPVDWQDLQKGMMKTVFDLGIRFIWRDMRYNNILPAASVWNMVAKMLIRRAVGLIAPYETVVTNRLHAVILSGMLKRQVVAYDNSYGKLSSYISIWLHDCPNIVFQS